MKAVLLLAISAVVVAMLVTEGDAVCCGSIFGGTCNDCTQGTPCCAHQTCNALCCSCAGGCRTGSCYRRRRSTDGFPMLENGTSGTGQDVIDMGDMNGDGMFDFDEALAYLTIHKRYARDTAEQHLMEMDKNNDRILSLHEIDE